MDEKKENSIFDRVMKIFFPALIIFSISMLVHTLILIIINVSLPNKLPQILLVLSTTLLNDSALLIDLFRGIEIIPKAYSITDVLAIGFLPWFIAGIFRLNTSNDIIKIITDSFYGVLISIIAFIYLWLVLGGFTYSGVILSFQFFTGAIVSIVLSSIGGLFGINLKKRILVK